MKPRCICAKGASELGWAKGSVASSWTSEMEGTACIVVCIVLDFSVITAVLHTDPLCYVTRCSTVDMYS